MPTYVGYCRRFNTSFSDCPMRQRGERCINCDLQVWILREKPINETKTADSEQSNQQETKTES